LEELRRLVCKDEKRKREEMEEVVRLRKETVHQANPIRRYEPTNIKSSDKPVTNPCTPSFMSRPRANSK
jgi:targeting protein for Xklp2